MRLGRYSRSEIDDFTDDPIGTNLLLWSEQFDHVGWNVRNGHVVTADQGTAPNGTLTADLVTVTTGTPAISQGLFAEGGSVNGPYCASIYMKAQATITSVTIVIKDRGTDTIRGTVSCPLAANWTRFPLLSPATQGVTPGFRFELSADQANGTFLVWGGDIKLGWVYTPYVLTTNAPAAR